MTLEKTALKWDEREGKSRSLKDSPIIAEGAAAYAAERAYNERALHAKFHTIWSKTAGNIYTAVDEGAEPETENSRVQLTVADDEDSDVDITRVDDSDED